MKATLRAGIGLLATLLLGSVSYGQNWVTPVFRQPYPVAPNTWNSGFYILDAWGRPTGPHWYLVPPCPPFNGILPGPTGQAIQSGNLPHTLLKSKEGMTIGNVPMLGKQSAPPGPGGGPPMPGPQGAPRPYPMPSASMQTPYGQPFGPMGQFNQFGQTQPFHPMQQFNQFGQMQQFNQFGQMQQFSPFGPMQAPRMDGAPPQQPMFGGNAYPTHPFTRSPRDFFMWGDMMEEERARGNRPFPVP